MAKISKSKILIVDDSTVNNVLLEAILTERGHSVIISSDGQEALNKMSGKKPDLILLDIMMPGMSGFDFLKIVRKDKKFKQVPVIMVSAKVDAKDKKKALEMGAADYVVKPVDIENITEIVERVLQKE